MSTYSDFEIDHLVSKRAHLITETELVVANFFCCEDIVALSFFLAGEDFSLRRIGHDIVNVEGSSRLNLEMSVPVILRFSLATASDRISDAGQRS